MNKIDEAISIIIDLGFPRAQQNERSALSLLALIQLQEKGSWQDLKNPLIGVRAILDFCRNDYEKPYAENSRESFRKSTLHQFVAAGFALQNPDDLFRSPNSPKWCYQIGPEAKALLETFGTQAWESSLGIYLQSIGSLAETYQMNRDISRTPCLLPNGETFQLSPGGHSKLIRDIIQEFGPRFAPGSRVLYVGDTGDKSVIFDEETLAELGIVLHGRGKLPDVILYQEDKKWLFLCESVTSVGPVDGKRHAELQTLFSKSKAGLVFVSAFPNRALMSRFLSDLAWECEAWCADAPDHLIHLNGDRFLGPHNN